jgi:beta-glucoside operon transcriptional antiterminator
MLDVLKVKYKKSYQCAETIKQFVKDEYEINFPEAELGYITLHICRIEQRI